MDLDQLKRILELVREHEVSEFEIEQDGLRLKIRKDAAAPILAVPPPAATLPAVVMAAAQPVAAAPIAAPAAAIPGAEAADAEIELAVVKSPIVGTFYRSSEPGSPAFVEVGASVKKG